MTREAIPGDIIVEIAKKTSQSGLLFALLTLHRASYYAILPVLYRSAHLRSIESLVCFCTAIINGDALLQSYPRAINVQIASRPETSLTNTQCGVLLRETLLLVHNLTNLVFVVSRNILDSASLFASAQYPFTLKLLFIPTRAVWDVINTLLPQQSQIEVLGIVGDTRILTPSEKGSVLNLHLRDTELLPRLRQVVVPWVILPSIIPARSVTSVDI
ncbi:hypothetical protein FRC07_003162, partial [Ceratobasidium sp. 392]